MNAGALAMFVSGAALMLPLALAGGLPVEEIAREKILASDPQWQENHDKYQPEPDMIEALRGKLGAGTSIDVYLGLWCADSRDHVPAFIKIADLIGPGLRVRYFNLPRKENKEMKFFIEELGVERLPTFIFYSDGKEIGRIVEKPKAGLIEDILEILFKS